MKRILDRVLSHLYPTKCVLCGAVTEGEGVSVSVCPTCASALSVPHTMQLRFIEGRATVCAAPLYYEGTVRESIQRYKFENHPAYAAQYARWMAECADIHLKGDWDVITWVPLGRKRLRQRGYDQSFLLAEALGRGWGLPCETLIDKVREIPPQSSLHGGAEARQENIRGAFAPHPQTRIRGRRILAVDDIFTTGATLSEFVRVLYQSGAAEVGCLTLAKTPGKGRAPSSGHERR